MYLIDVPNLKEIDPWEGYFYVVQKFFKSSAKKIEEEKGEEKCEENWAIFTSAYLVHH